MIGIAFVPTPAARVILVIARKKPWIVIGDNESLRRRAMRIEPARGLSPRFGAGGR
jgi:hypothetical protein